jgi:cytidylate kinase
MKDCIITISREFGSGGRDVGKLIAEELGLPIYDKEIMHMATEKSGLPSDFAEKSGESVSSRFMLNLRRLSMNVPAMRVPSGYNSQVAASAVTAVGNKPDQDKLYIAQTAVIREIAEQGGCVIVGRCAGYVLRKHPKLLSVFIRGNIDCRVRRAVEIYGLSEKNAVDEVRKIDKHRANYYKHYTERQWGSVRNYDLVVNTSYTDIPGAAEVIKTMVQRRTS